MAKTAKTIPTVADATARVARAEQRHDRARSALEAATDEHANAKSELSVARRALRDANRAEIEAVKS